MTTAHACGISLTMGMADSGLGRTAILDREGASNISRLHFSPIASDRPLKWQRWQYQSIVVHIIASIVSMGRHLSNTTNTRPKTQIQTIALDSYIYTSSSFPTTRRRRSQYRKATASPSLGITRRRRSRRTSPAFPSRNLDTERLPFLQ